LINIAVMILTRNEERMLLWSLRHYASFANEIIVCDNASTDDTRQIVARCPSARLMSYDSGGVLRDDLHARMKSQFETDCDWRIAVDADELLWHPLGVRRYLEQCQSEGITLPRTKGFDMIGDGWPADDGVAQLTSLMRYGVANDMLGKSCVVHRSVTLVYEAGCHRYNAALGNVVRSQRAEAAILHYKWADREWRLQRVASQRTLLSNENIRHGWGMQDAAFEARYYELSRIARREVVPAP
jgi:glycosyltransferase involved in cell wall biosynthesis